MRAKGADIVNLGVGEPDFPSPVNVKLAAIKAIEEDFTRYTATEGLLELREAICRKLKVDNSLSYLPNQIVVSNGGKHALHNIFQCLFQEGDEVLIPAPYWTTYPDLISLTGAKAVIVETEEKDDYLLSPQALRKALKKETKGLILNSPANPTGMVYSREHLEKLAEVIIEKEDLWVVSDDIYEKLLYDKTSFSNLAMAAPKLFDRVVIAHGVSKTYSMTGWRIGFLAGPESLAKAAGKFQSQTTSSPCSVAQKAALAALEGPQEEAELMRRTFEQRRLLALDILNHTAGFSCLEPKGAFYLLPDVSENFGRVLEGIKIQDSEDLAQVLLNQCLVACVPGDFFGRPGTLRFSYAASDDDLRRGLTKIAKFLA
jgi:aspartate aminotransferase